MLTTQAQRLDAQEEKMHQAQQLEVMQLQVARVMDSNGGSRLAHEVANTQQACRKLDRAIPAAGPRVCVTSPPTRPSVSRAPVAQGDKRIRAHRWLSRARSIGTANRRGAAATR